MQNIPETVTPVEFDVALRCAATKARTRYAGEVARIDRGLVLALNGAVTLHDDGTASVQSGSDPEVVYTVNGHCECPDATRATGGRCKHRWSRSLVKWAVHHLSEQVPQPVTARYYATYETPGGELQQGIAVWKGDKGAWVFIPDDGASPVYPAMAMVRLGGNVDIAEAKRAEEDAAGGLAALVCGYGK